MGKNEVIDNDREDWKRISASMRKQPDALRYDRQTIFSLVRERRSTFTKNPVALNKYITEYLRQRACLRMKEQIRAQLILSHQQYKLMRVETEIPDNQKPNAKWKREPSVEREGPFYFLFADKDGEKYGRANKLWSG